MKRLALFVLLAIALPLSARADDASRHAKATELVNLLQLDKIIKQTMDGMMAQVTAMSKQVAGSNVTPEQQAKIDQFQKKVFTLVESTVSWKEMQPIYVDLYAKTFTDDELDGIIAFYKSPAGIAIVDKTPGLTNQALQIGRQRMAEIQPQLMQMAQDFAKDAASPPKPK